MTSIALRLALGVTALVAAPCAAAPLEVYGRLPQIEQVALSPDGASLALAVTDGERREILIERLADHAVVKRLTASKVKIRDIQWAGPSNLLVTSSVTAIADNVVAPRAEWYVATDIDLLKNVTRPLMEDVVDTMNTIAGYPTVRIIGGKPFVFFEGQHFVNGQGRLSLFKFDVERGITTLRMEAFENTEDWAVDAGGEPLAESEFDAAASRWTLQVRRGDKWRVIKTLQASIEHPTLIGLGRDGRSILVNTQVDNKYGVRELEPDADDWSKPFAVGADQDFIFDPVAANLIGSHALAGDEDRYLFFDPRDQTIWNAARAAYPGQRVTLVSMSADHAKLVLLVDSPTDGPAYALVDVNTRQADWIGRQVAGLKPEDIAPVQPIAFKAKDGLALTGYLTLPRGRDAKNLPLVVFPHGGPAARDEPGFDWWAQAMASRGYAVLQVNYRGSEGFGEDFLEAGFGEWGRKMQTDLSDGVRYLAAQGTIDPTRVCIVGASYGGYAALAGAALDTGVYRCAVDVAGPADLRRFVAWSKTQQNVSAQRYWDRFMGAAGPRDPRLDAISPVDHADKANIPILIIHGRDDTVVPFEQSDLMAAALRSAGKPVELLALKSEDHWLSRGETRLQMLQATVAFLEKNNPPN